MFIYILYVYIYNIYVNYIYIIYIIQRYRYVDRYLDKQIFAYVCIAYIYIYNRYNIYIIYIIYIYILNGKKPVEISSLSTSLILFQSNFSFLILFELTFTVPARFYLYKSFIHWRIIEKYQQFIHLSKNNLVTVIMLMVQRKIEIST